MGLTLFSIVLKYLPFSEPEETILSPRTVLNIRFRLGQDYLFENGWTSPKIWRHHKPEVASSTLESRLVGLINTSQSEHSSVCMCVCMGLSCFLW